MSVLKELIGLLKGEYSEEEIKKGHTPGGTFISQNSQGLIKKDGYYIKIYCFNNMGTRASGTRDGSPYRIIFTIPLILKKSQTIFPKTLIQKMIDGLSTRTNLSEKSKPLLKKYSLKGNKEFVSYVLNDDFLTKTLPKHNVYISSSIRERTSTMALVPNESVINIEDLRILYDIMDRLGEIIVINKGILCE